jgi:hypothetical protein
MMMTKMIIIFQTMIANSTNFVSCEFLVDLNGMKGSLISTTYIQSTFNVMTGVV